MGLHEFGIEIAKILYALKKEVPNISEDKTEGYTYALAMIRHEVASLLFKLYGTGAWEEFFDISVNGKIKGE